VRLFAGARIGGGDLHGSGCAFASAVAASLALGKPLPTAVTAAKRHVRRLIEASADAGHGRRLRTPPNRPFR